MRRPIGIVVLAGMIAAVPVAAQFWTKKEYTEWSKGDCEKMLEDSPWARSRRLEKVMIQLVGEASKVEGRQQNPQITYTAQFYSAQPVRQADARLRQLNAKPDQAAAVEERNKEFLARKFPEQIAVRVSFTSNTPTYFRDVANYWGSTAAATVPQTTYLNVGKERIAPTEYLPPPQGSNQFLLLFPRNKDGKPIVTAAVKNISIEFVHPDIGEVKTERVLIQFEVKKMLVNNEPAI